MRRYKTINCCVDGCTNSVHARGMCRHHWERSPRVRHKRTGITKMPEYKILRDAIARCYYEKCDSYPAYGGRGIKVSPRWLEPVVGFDNFLEDMGRRPSKEHTLDRIDTNGDYSPENCRWATWYEQFRNLRANRWIEWKGRKMILADWLRELGANCWDFHHLIRKGFTDQAALSEISKKKGGRF